MKLIRLLVVLSVISLTPATVSAALPAADAQGNMLPSLAPLIERVAPAVVNINTFKKSSSGGRPLPRSNSAGSGVIVDAAQGLILSNHHVVAKADEVRISLTDGRAFKAELIGSDPGADLALLKIEADNLTALTLEDSDKLRVGDFVVAIGNPFGIGQTVTSGIVSALGRTGLGIESYENFIQTDASINPGNSGGALINLKGELVGINTAIIAPKGSSVGIGFAIPSNMARAISSHLARNGEVTRGTLGVSIQDLSDPLRRAFGVSDDTRGVVVTRVGPGSAAEKAGMLTGDIITGINDQPVASVTELRSRLGVLTLSKELQVSFLRKGEAYSVAAEIHSEQKSAVEVTTQGLQFAGAVLTDNAGNPGVRVHSVVADGPLASAGLKKSDVILSLNQQQVDTLQAFAQAISQDSNLLLVLRGSGTLYLVLEPQAAAE